MISVIIVSDEKLSDAPDWFQKLVRNLFLPARVLNQSSWLLVDRGNTLRGLRPPVYPSDISLLRWMRDQDGDLLWIIGSDDPDHSLYIPDRSSFAPDQNTRIYDVDL